MFAMILSDGLPTGEQAADQRLAYLLPMLAEAGFENHLLCVLRPNQAHAEVQAVRSVCPKISLFEAGWRQAARSAYGFVSGRSFLATRAAPAGLVARVTERIGQVGMVVCQHALHARVVTAARDRLPADAARPFVLLDLADRLSEGVRLAADARQGLAGWAMRVEAQRLARLESLAAQAADLTLLSSDVERCVLARRASDARLWTTPDGVHADAETGPLDAQRGSHDLMFCGDVGEPIDASAAMWLAAEVIGRVRIRYPSARLILAGRQASEAIRKLEQVEGVVVRTASTRTIGMMRAMTGSVLGVAPQRVPRFACPITMALLATGRPVVASQAVAQGLPVDMGPAVTTATDAADFAARVVELLGAPGNLAATGRFAAARIRDQASWPAFWRPVRELLEDLVVGDPPARLRAA